MDIEQPTETTETTPAPEGEASREDLIAAMKAAVPDGSLEAEGLGSEAPAGAPAEEEPRYARLVREREKGQVEREAGKSAAQQMIDDAKAEAARFLDEARAQAKAELAAQQEAARKQFAIDPYAKIRELGDPEEVAQTLLRANSPEYAHMRALEAEARAAREEAKQAISKVSEFETWKKEQADAERAAYAAKVHQEFLGQHASKEKAPYLHARYDEHEIIQRANVVADEWTKSGHKIGKDFDFSDISAYLESEAKKRLSALAPPASQVLAGPPGSAPKVSANGSRTITASAGSERRATPKPFADLSPEDQRADLINEVRGVFRTHGKT